LFDGVGEYRVEVIEIFKTPIFVKSTKLSIAELKEIKEECLKLRLVDSGQKLSNVNGWHSKADLFSQNGKTFPIVKQEIINSANSMIELLSGGNCVKNLIWKGQGWINISTSNDLNAPHDHPGFQWSGVLYISIPEDIDGSDGQIEFLDPRNSVYNTAGRISELQQYFASNIKIKPNNGTIILFPSYLRHWVYPHKSIKERISIAFNLNQEVGKIR
jgi:uncharacterized protein (TIGR02466 family)